MKGKERKNKDRTQIGGKTQQNKIASDRSQSSRKISKIKKVLSIPKHHIDTVTLAFRDD